MNANPFCPVLCLILTLPTTAKVQLEACKDRCTDFPDANGFHARGFEQQWISHFDVKVTSPLQTLGAMAVP